MGSVRRRATIVQTTEEAQLTAASCLPASEYPIRAPTPASPLWLGPPVATPRTEKPVQFSWADAGSSLNSQPLEGGRAACDSVPPASAELQAVVAGWNARLPLADILPLQPGSGYLVVRRRLHTAAPGAAVGAAPPAAPAAAPPAPGAAAAAAPWTAADEAHYQESLAQLRQLVALHAAAWPQIRDWYNRRALSAPAPGSAAALPQLLRWAVAARLAQLRRMQQQWVAAQAGAPAAPEPAQQQAPLFELEASAVLLQLSQGAGANSRQQAATAAASQPCQPVAEGHAAAAATAAMLPPPPRRHAAAPPSGAEQPPAKRRRSAC